MAYLPPHREGHSSGNTFPTVGASWDATTPFILQRSLSPSPPGHHAYIQQNTVRLPVNPSTLGQLGGGDREVTPFPAGNTVAQGQTQYPRHIDINMVHYRPPPSAVSDPDLRGFRHHR